MSEVNDTTSTCSTRNVVRIYTTVYDRGPYPLESRPLLLRLLFSDDAETVELSCRALKGIMQCISIQERDQFNLTIGERYLELLDSENNYVQWAAVCAGKCGNYDHKSSVKIMSLYYALHCSALLCSPIARVDGKDNRMRLVG